MPPLACAACGSRRSGSACATTWRRPSRPRARRSCACASRESATPTSSCSAATTPTRVCRATSSWAASEAAADAPEWVGRRVVGEINAACGACQTCRAGRRDALREAQRARHRRPRRRLRHPPQAADPEPARRSRRAARRRGGVHRAHGRGTRAAAAGTRVGLRSRGRDRCGQAREPGGTDSRDDGLPAAGRRPQPPAARSARRPRHRHGDGRGARAAPRRPRGRLHGPPRAASSSRAVPCARAARS